MIKRQRRFVPKTRPSNVFATNPTTSPSRARMAAYWCVMRDDWHTPGPPGNWNPPHESNLPRRQRSLTLNQTGAHSCENSSHPCYSSHIAQDQQQQQQQPLPHPRARSFDESRGRTQGYLQYCLRQRNSKERAQQQLTDINNCDDYGFLLNPSHHLKNAPLKATENGVGGNAYYKKELFPSISDGEENEERTPVNRYSTRPKVPFRTRADRNSNSSGETNGIGNTKRSTKLKRRKACYREKKEGRSRSLTHIDNLDHPAMLLRETNEEMDSRSEPDTSNDQPLLCPPGGPPVDPRSGESRRKILARSQVSSSEYFSICFEGELGSGLEEFILASRGMILGDALIPLFEKKNIDISEVNIFVDSSKTPLPSPSHTDTYFLAGKNLIVRAKETPANNDGKFHSRSFKQPSKSASQRGNKHRFFSSTSTEDSNYFSPINSTTSGGSHSLTANESLLTHHPSLHGQHSLGSNHPCISHEGSLKVKNIKQSNRWTGLFSNSIKDNSKMDLLVEQLNNYGKNGIPKLNLDPDDENLFLDGEFIKDSNPTDSGKLKSVNSTSSMDEDWKSMMSGWTDLSERGKQQQTAIWELVETEIIYIKTIKVITDLFLACLYHLQSSNILNEIDRDQLFSNITSIYKSNKTLWLECILPMVKKAKETNQPLQPQDLQNGFLKFGTTCQPYTKYCLDQSKCQHYCREKYQENELFKAYLAWAETRKECNRLRLMDILVRPMQRMTKYSLLLKAILKHTEDPDQKKSLEEMISSVEKFVKSVNGALRSRQETERLQGISERIESYEVVETRDEELETLVKSYSKLDLFHPIPGCGNAKRFLIYEGDLKIKDSHSSKIETHCFLFTDFFLVCKPLGKKGEKMKVIRQPFIVDRLLTREFAKDPCSFGLVYLNEYKTPIAALALHSNEPKSVKSWLEHIKKSQKLYCESKERERTRDLEYSSGEILDDDENVGNMNYLASPRSPRGSSRASQFSSLVHSHSGSIEMNEASNLSSRGISFEQQELRGSSLSSEDGECPGGQAVSSSSNTKTARALSIETGPNLRSASPRLERRLFMSKSPTPNTLSVQIPVPNLSGQSLPNLSSASDSSPPTYSHHNQSLVVPKCLSPTHRGISYPPPSPKLRRGKAIVESRNPPLQKSTTIFGPPPPRPSGYSLDLQVPEFRGVTPPSNDCSPIAPDPPSNFFDRLLSGGTDKHHKHQNQEPHNHQTKKHEFHSLNPFLNDIENDDVQIVHSNPESSNNSELGSQLLGSNSNSKRLARNERSEKRYHTAGAIEDIKRENSRDKNSAIHKRLSWNYGNSQVQQAEAIKNRQFFSCESMASVRSSSGVSSTSSLLHCISDDPDLETAEYEYTNNHTNSNARHHNHPDLIISEPEDEISPEISPALFLRSQPPPQLTTPEENGYENDEKNFENVRNDGNLLPNGRMYKRNNSGGGSGPGDIGKTLVLMKNFILHDVSVEASEV